MRPIFAKGKKSSTATLLELRGQAQKDKEPRVVLRIQGILMSLDGYTAGEIARRLKVHRTTVPLWIEHWNRYGEEGLWEGQRSGRPSVLSPEKAEKRKLVFDRPVRQWIEDATAVPGLWIADLTTSILIESCELPQPFHGDPADQMIVATVRQHEGVLITKDRRLRKYPHMRTLW